MNLADTRQDWYVKLNDFFILDGYIYAPRMDYF